MRILRLILAGLIFFVLLYFFVQAFMAILPAGSPEWVQGVGILVGFVVSLFLSNKLINVPGTKFWSLNRFAATPLEELEVEGLIVSTAYRARRAFKVEELDDEGPHYFVEVDDGSVLYLNGEYLEEFEPRSFLGISRRPREFPCSDFILRRHREDGTVLYLQCRGPALEPETSFPPFAKSDLDAGRLPEDGDVITTRTYDELKAARAAVSNSGS